MNPRRAAARGTTTVALLGAALAQVAGPATAAGSATDGPPSVPLAECHDMTLSFAHVSTSSYDVVVRAVVTRPGVFRLGDGHAYFGTSQTPPDPAGVPMTSTATIVSPAAGSTDRWTASCVGGSAEGTVHVPAAPRPPRVTVHGPSRVRATSRDGARDPLTATAVDAAGHPVAAHCTPAVLPLAPARTTVTCTARDSAGRTGRATRVVTVLGAAAQLVQLRDGLGHGHLRDLVSAALAAARARDSDAAVRELALVLDALPGSGLRNDRRAAVHADVLRISHVLARRLPLVHAVRPGETVWSIVRDALRRRTGRAPTDHAVALEVRLVLASNPAALDRRGLLHPGTVLSLPL